MKRELKVLRRLISAAILDNGSILAVLSSDYRVNIYNIESLKVKYLRVISLDKPLHAIALALKGEILAAAFNREIKLYSLALSALISKHRAIKYNRVDALRFLGDRTILIETIKNNINPNIIILFALYYIENYYYLSTSK